MLIYFIGLFKQPSTWRGFVMILTALGISLQPDQVEAIITGGLALVGTVEVFIND
jgi:hypothetical protein